MASQLGKKSSLHHLFCIFKNLLTQESTNQRLLENPNAWGTKQLLFPKNDFKTCSKFSEITSRFWRSRNQLI